ncbi:hypothetical protein N0V83_001097 [Neocucurbitaria cava]|uniref:AAA+ ATPase domain-containing protein n=1 Tax=Neocucurbitaria cava TaxID=798079 RepID=A0A9W9CR23_9PLEO|nr:hypothetical protein N0V83_001097 [Neocucurbitaria cava]
MLPDENPRNTDEAPRDTDEAPRDTDEAPRDTDEAPRDTDEASRDTDEAPRDTDEASRDTDEAPRARAPRNGPTKYLSWILEIANRGQDSWIVRSVESEFFERTCQKINIRIGGLDVQGLLIAAALLNAALVHVPTWVDMLAHQYKLRWNSGIYVNAIDAPLYNGVLQFACEMLEESNPSWFRLHGQYEAYGLDGQLRPVLDNTPRSFWYKGTQFTIEITSSRDDANHSSSAVPPGAFVPHIIDPTSYLTVRCFGQNNKTVEKLMRHIRKRVAQGQKMSVIHIQAGAPDQSRQRNKLSLSMVDLNPALKDKIKNDVEKFFHDSSKSWYHRAGRPYRHGYLLYGPPGTGKTSLSTALASHCNLPLVLISLRGMDDYQLQEAFRRVPSKSVVLLEDIDCAGVDISDRRAQAAAADLNRTQAGPSGGPTSMPRDAQAHAFESMLNQFVDEQNAANRRILSRVTAMEDRLARDRGRDLDEGRVRRAGNTVQATTDTPVSNSSSVSLSGLLNVIDGANSTEGRLLIMTTNHKEKLDPALYRAGRIERIFELGYANKETSLLTFKRLFDNDVLKRHTTAAINRFGKAFQDQFPSHSKITTAELAKYFGQYRGRPDEAVKDFADWLKVGDDKFTCSMDYAQSDDEDGVYNVPEPFDPALLEVSASDRVDITAAATTSTTSSADASNDCQESSPHSEPELTTERNSGPHRWLVGLGLVSLPRFSLRDLIPPTMYLPLR